MQSQQFVDDGVQKQVEEEMKEFYHTEHTILMKLVEVYEKRAAKDATMQAQKATAEATKKKPRAYISNGGEKVDEKN